MPEPSLAASRLVLTDALTADLEPDSRRPGEPPTSTRSLGTVGEVEVGVWQIEPGTAADTEADEVFVVLSGSGTVEFEDDTGIDLAPGVVVHLREGDRAVWRISEPLRKIYVAQ